MKAEKSGWTEAIAQDTARIEENERQLGSSIAELVDKDRIQSAMSISTFLNPLDEQIEDNDEEILSSTIEAYAEGDRLQENDEEPVEFEPIQHQEAMQAVQLLQRYEEQQEDGSRALSGQLASMESSIRGRIFSGKRQTQITSYFV